MNKEVTISKDLFDALVDHVTRLLNQELPCGFEIPAADRDQVIAAMPESVQEHVQQHWTPYTSGCFADYAEGIDIPNLN
jgi:hypothetical protein